MYLPSFLLGELRIILEARLALLQESLTAFLCLIHGIIEQDRKSVV